MSAAAAPSETPEQSKIPSCPATIGEQAIFSIGTSLRNCARSFSAPLRWFFQAIRVITSLSSDSLIPYFLQYAGASSENIAGADGSDAVPSFDAGGTTRPEYPESLSFSPPTAITTSQAPDATAEHALRNASEPVAH